MAPRCSVLPLMGAMAAALLAAGCDDGDDLHGDDDPTTTDITVTATHVVSEAVPTVVTVRWSVEGGVADQAWVEFGAEALDRTARNRGDGSDGWAYLLGLLPASTCRYRVVVEVDGTRTVTDEETVTTGDAPTTLPDADVAVLDGVSREGFIVTTHIVDPPVPVIYDREGRLVWWYDRGPEEAAATIRARLSQDGGAMLVQYSTADPDEWWGILRVTLDGNEIQAWRIADSHHDFTELPDGALVLIRKDFRNVDGVDVQGDQITELHPDGSQTPIWSAWDTTDYAPVDPYAPAGDWTHANSITYDATDDTYLLSLRNLSSIYKIDRATGDVLWRAGGPDADLVPTGGERPEFNTQHGFHLDGDLLTVFDNRASDDLQSRAVRYELDHDAGEARQVWTFEPDPAISAAVLGDVVVLPSGNTLVDFSTQGYLVEVDAAGEIVWSFTMPMSHALGYVEFHDTLE